MGNIASLESAPIKMLLIGDSGSGKTGALFSLAKEYELVWCDFDKGLDIIKNLVKTNPTFANNIYYRSFGDKMQATASGALQVNGIPAGFTDFVTALTNFKLPAPSTESLGNVNTWNTKRVLIIDSLTHLCNCILRYVLTLNGHQHPTQPDWGQAQGHVEKLLSMLYDDSVKCNVVVCAHVNYYEDELTKIQKGLPKGPGQALSPIIPTYFNTMVVAKTKGTGESAKRTLNTVSVGGIEAKVPVVGKLAAELPVETGLLDIFKALKGA